MRGALMVKRRRSRRKRMGAVSLLGSGLYSPSPHQQRVDRTFNNDLSKKKKHLPEFPFWQMFSDNMI
jgi:hypothetical protein